MLQTPDVRYVPEAADHADLVEAIAAKVFGPGRFARAAERVRETSPPDPRLSLVALVRGEVIGSVRQTRVYVGNRPAVMLGPLAVRPSHKGLGIGRRLMGLAEDVARDAGERAIVLVGDASYYEPLGYGMLPSASVMFPGPVDPTRILGLPLVQGGLNGLAGLVGPRRRV